MIDTATGSVAQAIDLAVTPVFLLAGVGAILSVLSSRLARIVDRSRVLHDRDARGEAGDEDARRREQGVLRQRVVVVNVAICLCTVCALLICAVVAILFIGAMTATAVAAPIAWCFVGAMGCLVVGLMALLVEIYLATLRMPIAR